MKEAFFGRDLLDQSRQVDRRLGSETPGVSQSGAPTEDRKGPAPQLQGPSTMATSGIKKQGTLRESFTSVHSHVFISMAHLCLLYTVIVVCVCVCDLSHGTGSSVGSVRRSHH